MKLTKLKKKMIQLLYNKRKLITKSLIFLVGVTAAFSFIANMHFHSWYKGKIYMTVNELIPIYLLLLCTFYKPCVWARIVFLTLSMFGFMNILYIWTGLCSIIYNTISCDIAAAAILLTSIKFLTNKNK